MYPTLGSNAPKPTAPPAPSAPPAPTSTTNTLSNTTNSLTNSISSNPVGFSGFPSHTPNQNNQQPMQPNNNASYSQPPYPTGQSSFPTGTGQTSAYGNPHGSSGPPQGQNQYASPYSMPPPGQGPPQGPNQYGQPPFQQNPNNYGSAYSQPYGGYQGQPGPPPQPMNPTNAAPYRNPYNSGNPYAQPPPNNVGANPNPYGQAPPNQSAYGNPYQQGPPQQNYAYQQGPPQQNYPYQQGPPQNYPYGQGPQSGAYGNPSTGYPQSSVPYQNPFAQPPPGAPGNNPNSYGGSPINERLRAVAGRYEISDALAQRLNILQQFELVVLCDDSGSMNTPVQGTNGTRWDELRTIVQIIIEIGTIFDANGVDVHFLNRSAMNNVTNARQVMESFQAPPTGLTPLTPALRKIFQSAYNQRNGGKRLLVFVATDGAPTDSNGTIDIRSLENLMRNERQANTTYVTFLACTDDDQSVAYLSDWDRTMMNVDVVDDYKTERSEVHRIRGANYPFSFGDYVVKALLGAVDPQIDNLDEGGQNNMFPRF